MEPADAKALGRLVKKIQKLGFLRDLEKKNIEALADGGVDEARGLFDAYFRDERRAIAEGYLTHDWRFGQETDDVIAEICARVGGPAYTQAAIADGVITVRTPAGEEIVLDVESLQDVIDFFDGELEEARR